MALAQSDVSIYILSDHMLEHQRQWTGRVIGKVVTKN